MRMTGTFLDAVVADIPSNNWGPEEWAADFDAMKAVGIDTVILIRTGWRDHTCFDSPALRKHYKLLPAYDDLLALFLDEAARCGMDFWFGGFDSVTWRRQSTHQREIEANIALADEVIARLDAHPAFRGWYLTHEIPSFQEGAVQLYERLARHLKGLKNLPTLISPWLQEGLSVDDHETTWREVFSRIGGLVDICAFQDGMCSFTDLPAYLQVNTRLCREYGLRCWGNVETFERGDVPLRFMPIDWRHLRYKIEAASAAGCEKLITFEFSHFLSPNSMYPSARTLYNRYRRWLEAQG
ncbi:MAG: DUF4434 domain-containing protein [Planctomycetes bacterium]|nr:DUF4434 domain-containing protein [Planctomycetota bacterium]